MLPDLWRPACGSHKYCCRKEKAMGFISGFVSYLLLLVVFCVVGGTAIFLGITLRKSANAKEEKAEAKEQAGQVQE